MASPKKPTPPTKQLSPTHYSRGSVRTLGRRAEEAAALRAEATKLQARADAAAIRAQAAERRMASQTPRSTTTTTGKSARRVPAPRKRTPPTNACPRPTKLTAAAKPGQRRTKRRL